MSCVEGNHIKSLATLNKCNDTCDGLNTLLLFDDKLVRVLPEDDKFICTIELRFPTIIVYNKQYNYYTIKLYILYSILLILHSHECIQITRYYIVQVTVRWANTKNKYTILPTCTTRVLLYIYFRIFLIEALISTTVQAVQVLLSQ